MRPVERIEPIIRIFLAEKRVREKFIEVTEMNDYYGVKEIPCGVIHAGLVELKQTIGFKVHSFQNMFDLNYQLNTEQQSRELVSHIRNPDFIRFWKDNHDMRFGQALVVSGYPDPGAMWYIEESTFFQEAFPELASYVLFWGTYGKDGKQPLRMVSLAEMTTDHIQACLETQTMSDHYRKAMTYEIKKRRQV